MFPCMNVDPDGVDDLNDYYLIADTSISCSSPRYFMGVTWATIFIFIYPIGIPALYYYLLCKKKREIQSRDDPNPRSLRSSVKMLEFLYKSYKPSAWYFEVLETFRRLFLTAFISVIAPGTPAQAILAMVATLIFMRLYVAVNPFPSDDERLMSKAGQYQIFITFLAALIIQNNLLGNSANDSIGVLLILVNIGVLVLSGYFEVRSIRETRADKTEGGKAEKREFSLDGKSDIVLEYTKDTLNPMASLQGNSIELVEIVSRSNILDAKNCKQDNFIKIEDKKLEFENDFKKNQECSNSITELSQISHHPSQSTGLNRDIENGARDTQGFGSVEVNLSAGGDVVKRIQQNMRLDTADSDDEF